MKILQEQILRALVIAGCIFCSMPFLGAIAYDIADYTDPLDMADMVLSQEVVDQKGQLLRAFATADGRWRLPVRLDDVDPAFIPMLIAYEDNRFYAHRGVDPVAILRAALQFLTHRRIVSGGSTITMQLARLMFVESGMPRGEGRSLSYKLKQVFRALQIERQLTKSDILERYLTLAPYGGNIEGVRAASIAYFGKEPRKLLLSEAALLVALPQAPESRRPDRKQKAARLARNRVLKRMAEAGIIAEVEIARASNATMPQARRAFPSLAAHLADRARQEQPNVQSVQVMIDADIQAQLEQVAINAARKIGASQSVAMLLADAHTGAILAEVGSADYFNDARAGWINMARVARSPGSTLKPFIYALALDEGLVAPETMMSDRPHDFGGYRPRNFDMNYQGDVTLRHALQMSLNVPAVQLLDAVGPARLMNRFLRGGIQPVLPPFEIPGLAIGLGGIGFTLTDLVQIYSAFANGGKVQTLFLYPKNGVGNKNTSFSPIGAPILSSKAAWQIADILSGVAAPAHVAVLPIAYKTGTSYGYRDAWALGFDGRYVLGVWVGRADNGAVPGMTGGGTAAPILFEAFARSGLKPVPFGNAPNDAMAISQTDLPEGLKRFAIASNGLLAQAGRVEAPQIVYPPQGAHVALLDSNKIQPLVLKLQGGIAPFRWLVNDEVLPKTSRRRMMQWLPDGPGLSSLTVIDANGQAASVSVFIE